MKLPVPSRYLRERFLAGRMIHNPKHGNELLLEFIDEIAHPRPHPTQHGRTVQQCLDEEKHKLLPLPNPAPSTDQVLPVSIDKTAFARFQTIKYSVPPDMACRTISLAVDDPRVPSRRRRRADRDPGSGRLRRHRRALEDSLEMDCGDFWEVAEITVSGNGTVADITPLDTTYYFGGPGCEWTCVESYHGDGYCDCGCNTPDVDCDGAGCVDCCTPDCDYCFVEE